MRKLLILGGTPQHIKLIEAGKAMGVYTIVTDYIAQSKAKEIADKSYCVDIKDINGLIDICKKEEVNGIISSHIDPCQRIYNYLCSQLHFHCYGTKEQFLLMTDKTEFKKMCIENNVDIILEYSFEDIKSKKRSSNISFPRSHTIWKVREEWLRTSLSLTSVSRRREVKVISTMSL